MAFDELQFSDEELALRRLVGPIHEPAEWPTELRSCDGWVCIRPIGATHSETWCWLRSGLDADRRRSLMRYLLGRVRAFMTVGPEVARWTRRPDGGWDVGCSVGELIDEQPDATA